MRDVREAQQRKSRHAACSSGHTSAGWPRRRCVRGLTNGQNSRTRTPAACLPTCNRGAALRAGHVYRLPR